jgi:hypothetical protein
MAQLIAALADFLVCDQDAVHGADRAVVDALVEGTVADVVEIWMTLSPAFSGYRVMRQRQAFADPS